MTGRDVKRLRQRFKLSQAQLGREIGTHVMTVSKWERGVANPSKLAVAQLGRLVERREREAQRRLPGMGGKT